MINRNKRSLTIDLSTDRGRELIRQLIPKVDVVVENFRPGTMERLGLGYARLSAINARLVYCGISAFGTRGSDRQRGAFDLVAQALSGLMSVTGSSDGELVKIGVPISDLAAGLYASIMISASLYRRELSGRGERVDISLIHSAMSLLPWEAAEMWSKNRVPRPMGTAHRNRVPYQAFAASDGMFIVGAGNESTWESLCEALKRPDLAVDPRFSTNPWRVTNRDELVAILSDIFATQPTDHWVELLDSAGCPASRVLNVAEAFESRHAREHDMVLEVASPAGDELLPTIGCPYGLEEEPPRVYRRPPAVGEHSREVLAQIAGLGDVELDDLIESKVIGVSGPVANSSLPRDWQESGLRKSTE
jgi:formyl-CoA transferase